MIPRRIIINYPKNTDSKIFKYAPFLIGIAVIITISSVGCQIASDYNYNRNKNKK